MKWIKGSNGSLINCEYIVSLHVVKWERGDQSVRVVAETMDGATHHLYCGTDEALAQAMCDKVMKWMLRDADGIFDIVNDQFVHWYAFGRVQRPWSEVE